MNSRDPHYRLCAICTEPLEGKDEGLKVYRCVERAVRSGAEEVRCPLCDEEVTREEAVRIVERGEPKLYTVG